MISVWLNEDNTAYRASMARAIGRIDGLSCPREFSSFERAEPAFRNSDTPDVLLLDVSVHAATTHILGVYEKLHVNTNTAAVAKALRERLI